MSYVIGPEYSIPYTLTGPDGAIAVFNDTTSPFYAGTLVPEECSGLESAEVRESSAERTEQDGAIQGNNFFGKRPIILGGEFAPFGSQIQRSEMMARAMRASNAMRKDATLVWTPENGTQVFVKARRNQPTKIAGNWVKKFQLALSAADPRIYSTTLNSATVTPVPATEAGRRYSKTYNKVYGSQAPNGTLFITNNGWGESPPIIRVWGPCINPSIINNTTGQAINLTYTLNAEQFLELDFFNRTIKLMGTSNRYSAMNFASSEWWYLQPDQNEIRLAFSSYETGAKMEVFYRDAWV